MQSSLGLYGRQKTGRSDLDDLEEEWLDPKLLDVSVSEKDHSEDAWDVLVWSLSMAARMPVELTDSLWDDSNDTGGAIRWLTCTAWSTSNEERDGMNVGLDISSPLSGEGQARPSHIGHDFYLVFHLNTVSRIKAHLLPWDCSHSLVPRPFTCDEPEWEVSLTVHAGCRWLQGSDYGKSSESIIM